MDLLQSNHQPLFTIQTINSAQAASLCAAYGHECVSWNVTVKLSIPGSSWNLNNLSITEAAPVHVSPISDKIYKYMPLEFNVYTPFLNLPNFLPQKPAATTY
jgi:hypothetical protein